MSRQISQEAYYANPRDIALKLIKETLEDRKGDSSFTFQELKDNPASRYLLDGCYFYNRDNANEFIVRNLDEAKETMNHNMYEVGTFINPIEYPDYFCASMIDHAVGKVVDSYLDKCTDLSLNTSIDNKEAEKISENLGLDKLKDFSLERNPVILEDAFPEKFSTYVQRVSNDIANELQFVENGTELEATVFTAEDSIMSTRDFSHLTEKESLSFMMNFDWEFAQSFNDEGQLYIDNKLEGDNPLNHLKEIESDYMVNRAFDEIEAALQKNNFFQDGEYVVNEEMKNILKSEFAPSLDDKIAEAEKIGQANKDSLEIDKENER